MPMQQPLTQSGFDQLTQGHPWLLRKHFLKSFEIPSQPCLYPLGEHWFWVSPQSDICFRRLGPATRHWPTEDILRTPITTLPEFEKYFFQPLLELTSNTLRVKQSYVNGDTCFRWLFSENDGVPGLIVDLYEQDGVAQILTAPVEYFWPVLKKILMESLQHVTHQPKTQFHWHEQRHGSARKQEGLPLQPHTPVDARVIPWNGLRWYMTPGGHQKTGAYLDQRTNHTYTATWAAQLGLKTAWDLFAFEGGFGLHLAKYGLQVLAVDTSEPALLTAQKNAELNDIAPIHFSTQCSDAFEFLKMKQEQKQTADVIILDPPAFAKQASDETSALRAYRDLNTRALRCLTRPGLLVSCSCSHHISPEAFFHMLRQSAHQARRTLHRLDVRGPAPDHAQIISFPEGRYLQAWFLKIT